LRGKIEVPFDRDSQECYPHIPESKMKRCGGLPRGVYSASRRHKSERVWTPSRPDFRQTTNEMFAKALNRNLNLQRYKVLYICGNYSTILSRLDRRFQALEIRRAFTVFQLMTILEEARSTLIFIKHDSLLYEDATGMVGLVSQAMSDAAKEAAVLLYSPGTDTFLEDLTRNADRVFYFDEGPRAGTKLISKAYPRAQKSQTTL
jgi:hypothetical protein